MNIIIIFAPMVVKLQLLAINRSKVLAETVLATFIEHFQLKEMFAMRFVGANPSISSYDRNITPSASYDI